MPRLRLPEVLPPAYAQGLAECIRCKHQASLTAGALFDNTKLPLRTLRLSMYLVTQSKNGISAMDLKRQLGVSYNTAWMVKLMQAMPERDDSQPLQGTVERDDAYLGGEASGQRGRGAAGKTPFVAAAQVSGEGRPERLRLSPVRGFRLQELEAWARQRLQPGTVVRSDGLSGFRGLQGTGCEHEPRVTGSGKESRKTPGLTWVNTLLGNVKRAIDGTYHACDPQYGGATSPSSPTASTGATSWPLSFPGSPMSRRVPLRCLTAS